MPNAKQLRFFIDISPLQEAEWTGIATVTANLVRYFLDVYPDATDLYYGSHSVSPDFVRTALESAPGGYLRALIESGAAVRGTLTDRLQGDFTSVGIFPSLKPFHRVFDVELVVVHDLSTILLPETHSPGQVIEHTRHLLHDVASSDLICCVSEATRQDVIRYLKVANDRVFVSPEGCDGAWAAYRRSEPAIAPSPYVAVLGTIEPRKNLVLIADFIREHPQILDELAFIFIGRRGWGPQFDEIFGGVFDTDERQDRIVFTDFVSDEDKARLLRCASFAVYPSLFEGFGLPVLEAMAIGCPVITSRSSSLLEFCLDADCYFDPLSLTDFTRAFRLIQSIAANPDARRDLSQKLIRRAAQFTWDGFAERIVGRIKEHLAMAAADLPATDAAPETAFVA